MHHNDAVDLLGRCPCTCHTTQQQACWCRDRRTPDPIEISHNDRVRHLGGCQCRGRACTNHSTSPELARALRRRDDDERERRIRSGRPRSGDIPHIARHPGRYPGYFTK